MHTLMVATRKGLFVVEGLGAHWAIVAHHFKGEPGRSLQGSFEGFAQRARRDGLRRTINVAAQTGGKFNGHHGSMRMMKELG